MDSADRRVPAQPVDSPGSLRRAVWAFAAGVLIIAARYVSGPPEPPGRAPRADDVPHQRLTPVDPPVLRGGVLLDAHGRPLEVAP